jgi:ubiquinone/menaquinone biosynthesis C-methylase UbiE
MNAPSASVEKDFDRIANLPDDWDHNIVYHDFLLASVPQSGGLALEVGCGTGLFSRRLAERCAGVRALDLSSEMIQVARRRSAQFQNITFERADFLTAELASESYECIVSIATVHHLPLAETLARMKSALRPGGVLMILDLVGGRRLADLALECVAVPASMAHRLALTGRLRPPKPIRDAWDAHGKTDRYSTISEIREVCRVQLPGASIRRHLYWRYSLIWKKPCEASNPQQLS